MGIRCGIFCAGQRSAAGGLPSGRTLTAAPPRQGKEDRRKENETKQESGGGQHELTVSKQACSRGQRDDLGAYVALTTNRAPVDKRPCAVRRLLHDTSQPLQLLLEHWEAAAQRFHARRGVACVMVRDAVSARG
jgi:hypothetical protein